MKPTPTEPLAFSEDTAAIEAAQQVVIVGKFDYIAKGEPYGMVPGFFARSKGHLEADLIYHAN